MKFKGLSEESGENLLKAKISGLKIMAERGSDKDGETIDKQLASDNFCDFQQVIDWTGKGLEDSKEEVRDLAGSILEQSTKDISESLKEKLRVVLVSGKGGYDEFRAACALFKHGEKSAEVVAKLNEF